LRVCIFSDVHANLPALESFVELTRADVDSYVCLGDVVDYGPWNDECLEMIHALPGAVLLEGNHERLFLGTEPIEHEIELVQEFFSKSIEHFSRRDLITNLPAEYFLNGFVCSHTIDGGKVYADTLIEPRTNCFIGHTHHLFRVVRSGRTIVNCGSVGQHRGRGTTLTWAVYDTDHDDVTLHEAPYPVERFISELVAHGYPGRCVEYLQQLCARRGGGPG
jgi:predicted phosphodiesterase